MTHCRNSRKKAIACWLFPFPFAGIWCQGSHVLNCKGNLISWQQMRPLNCCWTTALGGACCLQIDLAAEGAQHSYAFALQTSSQKILDINSPNINDSRENIHNWEKLFKGLPQETGVCWYVLNKLIQKDSLKAITAVRSKPRISV